MVKVSYEQKPFRRSLMHVWGSEVVASPSDETEAGRKVLSEHPDSPGSLGIAISEAVEDAAGRDDTAYSLGSVLNHVLLHQTVIGQEALAQMELAGAFPDVVIGCVGGGSNFAGLAFPFLREKFAGKEIDVLACEPAACPTLTRGPFAYDFGDTVGLTPLVPMHTLGHDFVPAPIHSGGLRYHGVAPLISQLVLDGMIRAEAYLQQEIFTSAVEFAGAEGIVPAPESAHAIHGAIRGRAPGRRGGGGEDDPLQPLRPRPLRHGRLRQLLRREAGGRRARRGRDRARSEGDRRAAPAGLGGVSLSGNARKLTRLKQGCSFKVPAGLHGEREGEGFWGSESQTCGDARALWALGHRLRGLLLVALGVVVFALPAGASGRPAAPTVGTVTPIIYGTQGANGWYITNVTVNWVIQPLGYLSTEGCDARTIATDTVNTDLTCTATWSDGDRILDGPHPSRRDASDRDRRAGPRS